jgi:signal transduction histidine kinase
LKSIVKERAKELEEAQERLMRMERLAMLSQMASKVGHELRNPLAAIKNVAYFLNMVLEDPDPKVKEMLGILEEKVDTCERIISSLLDFGRTKPPAWRKADINDIVQETLSRVPIPENVEVVSQLDEALPIIQADPSQLGQAFRNIILNAIQAMPEGGQLVVTTSLNSDSGEPLGPRWAAVSFKDTGVGIPEEHLGRIFEPLFTTKTKGIGLGLAVTRTLLEGHEGTIEVESQVGKGTTFRVRLPISAGEVKTPATVRGAQAE